MEHFIHKSTECDIADMAITCLKADVKRLEGELKSAHQTITDQVELLNRMDAEKDRAVAEQKETQQLYNQVVVWMNTAAKEREQFVEENIAFRNERERLEDALEEALEGPDVIVGGRFGAREDHDDFVKRIRAIAEGKKP